MGSDPPPAWSGPFVDAFGSGITALSPAVRRHLVPAAGAIRCEGSLRRIWSRGIAGRIVSRLLHLRGEERGLFRLENRFVPESTDVPGGPAMTWHGTHAVNGAPVHRVGVVRWKPAERVLVDRIGPRGWLEVELVPRIDDGAVTMTSARQWARIAGIRLPMPRWLFGGAATREWEEPDGRVALRLALHHPLLGEYAGYEAVFAPADLA